MVRRDEIKGLVDVHTPPTLPAAGVCHRCLRVEVASPGMLVRTATSMMEPGGMATITVNFPYRVETSRASEGGRGIYDTAGRDGRADEGAGLENRWAR